MKGQAVPAANSRSKSASAQQQLSKNPASVSAGQRSLTSLLAAGDDCWDGVKPRGRPGRRLLLSRTDSTRANA